ncbi:MAG: ATP-binding protein [Candidatus Omnitrophota bacterium]|jgi:hypothetical protein
MFSEPAVGEKFFGREEVLELLNKRVLALKEGYRQNVALTGPSLAGKSSIILHFLHMAKNEGFVPVYVEIVKEGFDSFANKFIATLLYNTLQRLGEDVSIDISDLLERAQRMLPKTHAAIKQVLSLVGNGELDEAYLGLLALTSTLKSETALSCVVILDEFDNLENLGIKNPFLGFGKIIMVQKDTMYIVSSSRNEAIKKIISEKLSLLFGNFEVVKVRNFDFKTSAAFLGIRFSGFDVPEVIRSFLTAFTGGNPFYLDRITLKIKEIAAGKMSGHIEADAIADAIIELVYNANGAIHQYLINYLLSILDTKDKNFHMDVLISIASGINKQQEIARALKTKLQDTSKAVAHLSEIGLISKNGIFYEIEDAMLEFWLKNVYKRRRDLLIDGTFDKMTLFKKEVVSHIAGFEHDFGLAPEERIAELFNIFCGELVAIDGKNARLPRFTKVEVKTFADSSKAVAASFRGNYWIAETYKNCVNENDIVNYIKNVKSLSVKASNRVIIPLRGIDENAKLLAKELKLAIWDIGILNSIFGFYGKKKMVVL